MTRLLGGLLVLGILANAHVAAAAGPAGGENLQAALLGLALPGTDGRDVPLAGFKDKKAVVVVFTGSECPVNNFYMQRLAELAKSYKDKGVQFLAINSNSQDSMDAIAKHAKQYGLAFPVLKDADQKAADAFKAERTPEAFVVDRLGKICYRGRIDDQFGVGFQRPKPTRADLATAIDEVLAGKAVSVPRTQAAGCLIARTKKADPAGAVTYTNQIARIFQKNCQECHRPGQIGPFSLLTYGQAKGWADMIRETVSDGRMPPWLADPHYGKFANDRRLSKEDKATLMAWIDQGCPRGADKDLPAPKDWYEGWWIGKPDAIITMQEDFTVPASPGKNGIPYKYFTVPTNFTEDKWIQAAEARPGNKAVVHHIIVTASGAASGSGRFNYLVGVAPGEEPLVLPSGMAKKISKGAKLTFQMHYTANGTEQKDRSSVGLIFCKEPPKHTVHTASIMQMALKLAPGDGNYQVVSSAKYDKDTVILSFMPHMHVRGKDFEYRVEYPDGRSEVVLSVPRYDFNWQLRYVLDKPLLIPAGSKVLCKAHFDNSTGNPNNPDPAATVRWGQQTWDEMMIGWMQYYHPEEEIKSAEVKKGG